MKAQDGSSQTINVVLEVVNAVAEHDPAFIPYEVKDYKRDPVPRTVKMLRRMVDDLEEKWKKATKSETGKSKKKSEKSDKR